MPILHGVNPSPFVHKARVALAEKGIEYESVPVMPMGQTPEYLKISPLGKIPCYQDGDFTLPDSSCIIAYLERIQPTPALYPADAKEFGRALFYEEYSDSKLSEAIGPIFFNRVVNPKLMKQPCNEELVQEKLGELQPLLDYLEGELREGQPMVGSQFSVADVALGSIFVNLAHAGEGVGSRPKLAAYVESIHARPSFKGIIEEEKAFFASA